jgi:hypothetical protein
MFVPGGYFMSHVNVNQPVSAVAGIHAAGILAIVISIISAIGVVLLIAMFYFLSTPNKEMGYRFGMLNDICVAIQYLLTIPVALALYPILKGYNPALVRIATITGIISMIIVVILQLLLIFKVLTFEQQVPWVSLAMLLGVGFWLVVTGLMARSTGRLPNSMLMSGLAVPYVGYPAWALWLGLHLLKW